jgi:hypothetical protein
LCNYYKQSVGLFELKGNRIECENDVKLLGVTIDYELKFDISDICKKKKASISFIKILNNTGFKIDPCETPLYIYLKLLHTFSTLIHCFL